MVSVGETPPSQPPLSSPSSTITKSSSRPTIGRSMRTFRSTLSRTGVVPPDSSEFLTDSFVDVRLIELARDSPVSKPSAAPVPDFLDLSQAFSDFSAYSIDISGELERLASLPASPGPDHPSKRSDHHDSVFPKSSDSCEGVSLENEDLDSLVQICVGRLQSTSIPDQRSAAAKLRLLAKNQAENRALIGSSGAIQALIPLLRSTDPSTQEYAATALLNLSLYEPNKELIADAGAIKPLVYALKTGTAAAKQNAACALLSLALVGDESQLSIGACGAIPPLVAMLMGGSARGKKDAVTALYKLCAVRLNKERVVRAGAVGPLIGMVVERAGGLAEKAMVVLSSLAGIPEGKEALVEEGGIPALVEAIEDGSAKGKEFAVSALLQLCGDSVRNRGLLVREGGIPPLVALSQAGTARSKLKAETLLRYVREHRQDAAASSS